MPGGTLKIEKSSFLNNKAQGGHGGAIYIKNSNDAHNTIYDTFFQFNEADKEGSAIYTNSKYGGLTVTKSTFNRNYAQKPSDATIGGTITIYNGYLTIDDCNFEYN